MWLSLVGKWFILTRNWNLLFYVCCRTAISVGSNSRCIRKVDNRSTRQCAVATNYKAARYNLVRYGKGVVTHGCPY